MQSLYSQYSYLPYNHVQYRRCVSKRTSFLCARQVKQYSTVCGHALEAHEVFDEILLQQKCVDAIPVSIKHDAELFPRLIKEPHAEFFDVQLVRGKVCPVVSTGLQRRPRDKCLQPLTN